MYSSSIIITGGFVMSLRTLAEAVIIQSAEDILDEHQSEEAATFFGGEGFRICAGMAGMDHSAQSTILNLIRRHITVSKLLRQKNIGFELRTT
jgi:hypothetical protein